MKRIGVLTSGGDAPGMNAAIRAITKACIHYEIQPIGIRDGFEGMERGDFLYLKYADVDNIIQRGGTILGAARCPEFKEKAFRKAAEKMLKDRGIDGLITIGGEGTLHGAFIFSKETDIPIIGLPGTIDNDVYGTDSTIGYDTALNTIVTAVDNIRDSAVSHKHIFFVEVMGRNSGFLALNSAIACGAESVLIPETVTDLDRLAREIRLETKGRRSTIIIVAEGDEQGGAMDIKRKMESLLPEFKLRTSILGYIQRGGNPTYYDRSFATELGLLAVESLLSGASSKMIGVKNHELVLRDLSDIIGKHAVPDLKREEILKKLLTKQLK